MTLAVQGPARCAAPLFQLSPRWRAAALLLWAIVASCTTDIAPSAAAFLGSLALFGLSGLDFSWLISKLKALTPFVLLLALPLIALQGGAGVSAASLLVIKTLAIALPTLTLMATTPSCEIWSLFRTIRVPGRVVHLFQLAERHAVYLAGSFNRTRRAMCIRGFRWQVDRRTYQNVGVAIGSLAFRGLAQARRVERALACRGFDGEYRNWRAHATSWVDMGFCLIIVLAGIALLSWNWWPTT